MLLGSIAVVLLVMFVILFIDHQTIDAPNNIVLTFGAMILTLIVSGLTHIGVLSPEWIDLLKGIDLSEIALELILGILLFVGAMNFSAKELNENKRTIMAFAVIGTVISISVVGGGLYMLSGGLGLEFDIWTCFLFGAIVAPTDPIAVISMLTKVGLPHKQLALIEGESLFNDGIGVVLFLALLSIVTTNLGGSYGGDESNVVLLFLQEVGGGVVLGGVLGYIGHELIHYIKGSEYMVTLMMLLIIFGGGALAYQFHVSGPLAMVVVGLIIGNEILVEHVEDMVEENLRFFRGLVETVLTGVIFLLVGMSILTVVGADVPWYLYLLVLLLTLFGRAMGVGLSSLFTRCIGISRTKLIPLMTIGGLKGAISVALAMTLTIPHAEKIIALTSVIVLFSIIVQGLSLPWVVKELMIQEEM